MYIYKHAIALKLIRCLSICTRTRTDIEQPISRFTSPEITEETARNSPDRRLFVEKTVERNRSMFASMEQYVTCRIFSERCQGTFVIINAWESNWASGIEDRTVARSNIFLPRVGDRTTSWLGVRRCVGAVVLSRRMRKVTSVIPCRASKAHPRGQRHLFDKSFKNVEQSRVVDSLRSFPLRVSLWPLVLFSLRFSRKWN